MIDDAETKATRSDSPSPEDSFFGKEADDKPVSAVEEEVASPETSKGQVGDVNADKREASTEELKVVVAVKAGRSTIGVQRPSSDPHIESFDGHDLPTLAQEVLAVTERARARWEDAPKHPAYERPDPRARPRRNRRQQGAAQTSTVEGEAQEPQQTLRLF